MATQIVELECPGCAAPISTETKICPKCFRPIVITTFHSINGLSSMDLNKQANTYRKAMTQNPDHADLNMSIAFCYLKLKLYDKALPCFDKALEENFDNPEVYFYAAIACLKGKRPFLVSRAVIGQAEEYLNAAIGLEPRGIFYYFWAYLRYDHHFKKLYNVTPNYDELLIQARAGGYSDTDANELFQLLGVERPNSF